MQWFTEPITNHYFDFEGRATRQQFWMFVLYYIIGAIILGVIESMVGLEDILTAVYALALLLPYLGLAVRRLHDVNRSGWWLLIGLIPIVGFIVLLIFYIQKGDAGANQYGPNPAGVSVAEAPQPASTEVMTPKSEAVPQPTPEEKQM